MNETLFPDIIMYPCYLVMKDNIQLVQRDLVLEGYMHKYRNENLGLLSCPTSISYFVHVSRSTCSERIVEFEI
jgi:hypothetical protein